MKIRKSKKSTNVQSSEYEIDFDRDPARNFKNAYYFLCSGLSPYQSTNCNFQKVNSRTQYLRGQCYDGAASMRGSYNSSQNMN